MIFNTPFDFVKTCCGVFICVIFMVITYQILSIAVNTVILSMASANEIASCEKTHKINFGPLWKNLADFTNCAYVVAESYGVWHLCRAHTPDTWYDIWSLFRNPNPTVDSTLTKSVMPSEGGTPCTIGKHAYLSVCCTNGWRQHKENENNTNAVNYNMTNSELMDIEVRKFNMVLVFSILVTIGLGWCFLIILRSFFYWFWDPLIKSFRPVTKDTLARIKQEIREEIQGDLTRFKQEMRKEFQGDLTRFKSDIVPRENRPRRSKTQRRDDEKKTEDSYKFLGGRMRSDLIDK